MTTTSEVRIDEAFCYCTVTAFCAGVVVCGETYIHEIPWSTQASADRLVAKIRARGTVNLAHWQLVKGSWIV